MSDVRSLRVVTCNIYNTQAGWEKRREVLGDGLIALDPDIIALQEVARFADHDQASEIVPEGMHIVTTPGLEPGEMGVSVASRWSITQVAEVDLRVTDRHATYPLSVLAAEVVVSGPVGKVLVVAFPPDHEPDQERERELQVLRVAQRVEELVGGTGMHTVLLGDLNAGPDSATMRFLTGRQSLGGVSVCYRDAWERVHGRHPGPTYSSRNALQAAATWDWPFEQIDHILVRCGAQGQPTLDIAACEIALNKPVGGIWASDHVALVADLVVP